MLNKSYYFYILDDEADVLESIADLVESSFSCKTRKFLSVLDAFEALKQEKKLPDLIYSDIRMGEVSGLLLRGKLEEFGYDIPILFITGLSGKEGYLNGYWSINKPISKESLKKYTQIIFHENIKGKKIN